MASDPEQRPSNGLNGLQTSETEPLLGRPGDAVQSEGQSFLNNLVIGKRRGLPVPISLVLTKSKALDSSPR